MGGPGGGDSRPPSPEIANFCYDPPLVLDPLLAHGARSVSRKAAVATQQSASNGQCDNAGDRAVIQQKFDSLKGDIQWCMISCLVGGESCAKRCVQDLGLSEGCATCWVGLGTCTRNNCVWSCLNPSSAGCARCAFDTCFPSLISCSGLNENELPPP